MAHATPLPSSGRSAPAPWRLAVIAVTLGVGLALTTTSAHSGEPLPAMGDLAVAAAFVGCGTALWWREATFGLTAPLMVAAGAAWIAGSFVDELALLHRGPLVQLLLTTPGGRPDSRAAWPVIAGAYLHGLVPGLGDHPAVTLTMSVLVAGLAVARWTQANGLHRRAHAVPAAAAVAVGLVLVAGAFAGPADAEAVLWSYQAVLVATVVALFVDLRAGRWSKSAVTSLVIDLGDPGRDSLARALAHALGDASLRVGYRRGDGSYVDDAGRPVAIQGAGGRPAVTAVQTEGEAAAVLVHDPAALRAPGLAEGVTAAVRLALENRRLEEGVRARMREVAASRARLLRALDDERARLEDRLRAGVEQRLDAAGGALAALGANAQELVADLERARAALRRVSAGLHPRELESGGLAAALHELAVGAPLPVHTDVRCGRLSRPLELAAWFVCSEALANAVKHSGATRVEMKVERAPGGLTVRVSDDGRGGADPAVGHGLRGLAARVEATGGRLEVGDAAGGGTCLVATLGLQELS